MAAAAEGVWRVTDWLHHEYQFESASQFLLYLQFTSKSLANNEISVAILWTNSETKSQVLLWRVFQEIIYYGIYYYTLPVKVMQDQGL